MNDQHRGKHTGSIRIFKKEKIENMVGKKLLEDGNCGTSKA
jgi:hypothetical protein